MKLIKAKFKSTCAETGQAIKKGEPMYYDYAYRKCYCMNSKKAKEAYNADAEGISTANYIQAQEEAYWNHEISY